MDFFRSPFRFLADHSAWRLALLALTTAFSFAFLLVVLASQPPPPTQVITVATVRATGCGTFGNLTCHLVGTTDGQVLTITDDSWVLLQPTHCYRLTLSATAGTARAAHEVGCPPPLTSP
jgi:hypothetical protein